MYSQTKQHIVLRMTGVTKYTLVVTMTEAIVTQPRKISPHIFTPYDTR